MLIYNLFICFSVRDRTYLYYCGYLFMVFFIANFISGNYVYRLNILSYLPDYLLFFTAVFALFISLFLVSLLQAQRKQLFYKVVFACCTILLILGSINLFTGHYATIIDAAQGVSLLTFIYLFFYGISLYRKGNTNARFVVFGFSFYLLGSIIYMLQSFGLLPNVFLTTNAVALGSSIKILLFSLALSDKINTMRKEKELSQAALLVKTRENEKLVRKQNIVLEQKVKERTEELQQTNEELSLTLDTVAKQRDDIISSINYALRIQNAIIPKESELQKYLDCFVFFRPRDIVSGDFYWFADKGDAMIFAVADCTGHGVSGAFMTMIGNNILNQIVNENGITEPDEILNHMPPILEKTLSHAGGKVKDGMDISVITFRKHSNPTSAHGGLSGFESISYAGAKSPLYYVQNGELKEIKADKRPIEGRTNDEFAYQKHCLNLAGAMIYLCSDGYQDQFGGAENKKFMTKEFKILLAKIANIPLDEQKRTLEKAFDEWKGKGIQTDDVLVTGIRV